MENVTFNSSLLSTERNLTSFSIIISVVVLSVFIALLNVTCIAALLKSVKLQKSRFHFLTLCLSVGDFSTIMFVIILLTNSALETFGWNLSYLCSISSSFAYCSVLFSLFQALSICIERYFATSVKNRIPKLLSKIFMTKKMMLAFYFICVLYTITILYGNGFTFKNGCAENQYSSEYFLFKELPLVILFLSTIILYGIIMKRLRQMLTRVSPGNQIISELHYAQRLMRLKMNIITLGLLLVTLTFGVLPRIILALSGPAQSGNYGNICLLLSPMFNPIIFVLRFPEFRNILKPRCCTRVTVQKDETNINTLE